MPNEALISRIETLLDEVVSLGGANERTGIVSGLIVVDSAPSSAALANHIIVRDSRDGNFISVLKTPGQTYANNDLVSVLFIEGTEPIALAQSPGSSSGNVKVSEVWESDFGAVAGSADAAGNWTWQNDVTLASGDLAFGAATPEISSTGSITLRPAVGSPVIIADASGNTRGLRILGSTPADEIVDLFVGSTGTFYVDFTNSGASAPYMEIRPTDNEYGLKVIAPGAAATFLNMFVVDATVDYANLTVGAVGGTDGLFVLKGGKIGINTSTIPHGGIGAAMLALDGANASAAGPHVQFTTATDDYPVYQQLNWAHDNVQWLFDSYFNGTNWFSSDVGSNIRVLKGSDSFRFDYAAGIAQGSAITWSNGITLNPLNGRVGIGVTAPAGKTHIDQASTTAAIPVLYLDQADLSEEFIEFAATVGAGNPIDTAAIGTYYGKIRVAVAGVGFKYMALYNT